MRTPVVVLQLKGVLIGGVGGRNSVSTARRCVYDGEDRLMVVRYRQAQPFAAGVYLAYVAVWYVCSRLFTLQHRAAVRFFDLHNPTVGCGCGFQHWRTLRCSAVRIFNFDLHIYTYGAVRCGAVGNCTASNVLRFGKRRSKPHRTYEQIPWSQRP